MADGASRLGDTSKSLQKALEDVNPEKVRELIREKNRQIKELEEERHDRAVELESVKVNHVKLHSVAARLYHKPHSHSRPTDASTPFRCPTIKLL